VSDAYDKRKLADKQYLLDLFDIVFQIKVKDEDIQKMFRLDRMLDASNSSDGAVRPLLVSFSDAEVKDRIMANLMNLRSAHAMFTGISISHDLTPKQREDVKKLIAIAKKEHEDHSSCRRSGIWW